MTETPNFDIDFDAVERAARILEVLGPCKQHQGLV